MDKKVVTAGELSQRFEVSTRTIYRDIETLSTAGIPVYMSKGKGGGISLLPNYILNKTVITEQEREEILSSMYAVNAVDLLGADTALRKLASLFGGQNTDWIEVDFSSWGDIPGETELFQNLKNAILKCQVLEFGYSSAKGQQTRRQVEPLKLCFKGGAWYLYGFCRYREDYRFFKLHRIREMERLEEHFLRSCPKEVVMQENTYGREEIVEVELKLSPQVAYRVYDEFDNCKKLSDGSFEVTLTCPNNDWLYSYIATFRGQCQVVNPPEVRRKIKEELQQALAQYSRLDIGSDSSL